ncbi:MAG TPA: SIS domain-containing protein [Patescibacteria group bacterium]|nr:SIS domain-containing protein [Patescibacteria group bacterium]
MDLSEKIKKNDPKNLYASVEDLSKQVEHAWEDAGKVEVPESYKDIKNIIMCGMGGSGLGARVIESVYFDKLKCPLVRVNDYNLPPYCSENSLVICSSYSGETEETIQNAGEAIQKNAKWMVVAKGGKLIDMAKEHHVPYYQIDPKFNTSQQPRMAIGYSVIGQMVLAYKSGLIDLTNDDLKSVTNAMEEVKRVNNKEVVISNASIELSNKIKDKIVIFVSAKHLVGASHVVNNQQNENSKNLCFDVSVPELNHHLMEGLVHPFGNAENVVFIFFESDLYPERIQKRMSITQNVVRKNDIEFQVFKPKSANFLSQAFEVIQFGAYLDFYLSMQYEQDPTPIPWVDYFKVQLGQPLGK